jgi:hypothetical protein
MTDLGDRDDSRHDGVACSSGVTQTQSSDASTADDDDDDADAEDPDTLYVELLRLLLLTPSRVVVACCGIAVSLQSTTSSDRHGRAILLL